MNNPKPGDRITITCDIYGTFEAVVTAIEAPDASGTYKLTCQRLRDPASTFYDDAQGWQHIIGGPL